MEHLVGSILENMIIMNTTLYPKYLGLEASLGQVNVIFSEALTQYEHDELNLLIDDYGPDNRFYRRYFIRQDTISPAVAWGQEFLKEFVSNNVERAKTPAQIQYLMSTMTPLIFAAHTGSLTTLYSIVQALTPDEGGALIQEEIDEFKRRIQIRLGIV